MVNLGTFGQFVPGDSPLHRLDPRSKVIWTIVHTFAIFLPKGALGIALAGAVTVAAMLLARIPAHLYWRTLRPVLYFGIFTIIASSLLTEGKTIYGQWGPFIVSREGFVLGVSATVRFTLVVLTASLLTFTTTPIALTDGIERLLRPFSRIGVPSHELALMMSIAIRFVPTLVEEAARIIRAQTARGADFKAGGLAGRVTAYVPVLVPLFVSAFRRADDLAIAIEARAYRGGAGRTRMTQLTLRPADVLALLFALSSLAFFWWLRTQEVPLVDLT